MSAISDRLRLAIENYAPKAFTIRGFAGLVDIPYRTLQNYLSGERSPNVESLEKLARHGINIDWLVTGRGAPYSNAVLDSELSDIVFTIHALDIIHKTFGDKRDLYTERQRFRLLSFMMANNFLGIGEALRAIVDNSELFPKLKDFERALAAGELDALFHEEPSTPEALREALKHVERSRMLDQLGNGA